MDGRRRVARGVSVHTAYPSHTTFYAAWMVFIADVIM